ncbi:MAG: choice-of-anchor D domain-containing protein [Bacteroidota bacterium]|nr:choice-of-anchor D domain-containing protein [Bacteroidota bacterium]
MKRNTNSYDGLELNNQQDNTNFVNVNSLNLGDILPNSTVKSPVVPINTMAKNEEIGRAVKHKTNVNKKLLNVIYCNIIYYLQKIKKTDIMIKHFFLRVLILTSIFVGCVKEKEGSNGGDDNISNDKKTISFEHRKGVDLKINFDGFQKLKSSSAGNVTYPPSVFLDVPIGRDQGIVGSCVSFATTSQVSFYVRDEMNMSYYNDDIILSASYLHSLIRTRPGYGCLATQENEHECGAYFSASYTQLKDGGCASTRVKPYSVLECLTLPNESQMAQAKYRIGKFYNIDFKDIRRFLRDQHPVVAGIHLSNGEGSFREPYYDSKYLIWSNNQNLSSRDNHAVLINGYEEINGEAYYFIINSWGEKQPRRVPENILRDALIKTDSDYALFVIDRVIIDARNHDNNDIPDKKSIIEINENRINFEQVIVGETKIKRVLIKNKGSKNLIIAHIDTPSNCYVNWDNKEIEPNSSKLIEVRFTPSEEGVLEAELVIRSNAFNAKEVRLPISANVIKNQKIEENPEIRIQGNLNFGNIMQGTQQQEKAFYIRNTGRGVLSISKIEVPDGFSISPTRSIDINAGESRKINVRFKPDRAGQFGGMINVISNAVQGDSSIEVSAYVEEQKEPEREPSLSVSTTNLHFGNILVGNKEEKYFQISNNGGGQLRINRISAPYGYRVGYYPRVLNEGETIDISVEFSPSSKQYYNGTIIVESNGGNESIRVTGYGKRPEQPEPSFSPAKGQFTRAIRQSGRSSCGIYLAGPSLIVGRVKEYDSASNIVTFSVKKIDNSVFTGRATIYVKQNSECASRFEASESNVNGRDEVEVRLRLPSRNGSYSYYLTVTSVDQGGNTHYYHCAPIVIRF